MTPRERWLALLAGKSPDRIPTDYQAVTEVTARLLAELECPTEEDLWRKFHIDKRRVIEPAYRPVRDPEVHGADPWGVRYRRVEVGPGSHEEPFYHPLADAEGPQDIRDHAWPDADDFDYSPITQAVEAADGHWPIHAGRFEPFLIYCRMRGTERAIEDLSLRPAIADAALGRLGDFYADHHRRIFEAGKGRIDLTWVADDLGSPTGPLISLSLYRRFLLPGQVRMADLARRHKVHVLYHTDGAVRIFLPDLIDRVGIEVLSPIQWRSAGMDRAGLVRDFGRRLAFHGAIDNQITLPFGGPVGVAGEVRDSVEAFKGARWICAPSNDILPNTPTENILALYGAIHAIGKK